MDDMAEAMTIHENIFLKDKILQPKPPSKKIAKINWSKSFPDVLKYNVNPSKSSTYYCAAESSKLCSVASWNQKVTYIA